MEKNKAKVVWFDSNKGFGFLAPDAGGKDIFVHYTALIMEGFKTLQQGQAVSYEVGSNGKGDVAVNVELIPGKDKDGQ